MGAGFGRCRTRPGTISACWSESWPAERLVTRCCMNMAHDRALVGLHLVCCRLPVRLPVLVSLRRRVRPAESSGFRTPWPRSCRCCLRWRFSRRPERAVRGRSNGNLAGDLPPPPQGSRGQHAGTCDVSSGRGRAPPPGKSAIRRRPPAGAGGPGHPHPPCGPPGRPGALRHHPRVFRLPRAGPIVFDQGLGDLLVIRVAGNIVAPSQVGSVEFAATKFGTPLVVVLGHSDCGAIAATIEELRQPAATRSRNLRLIVNRIRPSVEALLATQAERGSGHAGTAKRPRRTSGPR